MHSHLSSPDIKLTIDRDNEIVRIRARGMLDMGCVETMVSRARLQACRYNYAIFYDLRSSVLEVERSDWFYLLETLSRLEKQQGKSIQVALLLDEDGGQNGLEYYSSAALDAGMMVEVFYNYHLALDWLTLDTATHVRKLAV